MKNTILLPLLLLPFTLLFLLVIPFIVLDQSKGGELYEE